MASITDVRAPRGARDAVARLPFSAEKQDGTLPLSGIRTLAPSRSAPFTLLHTGYLLQPHQMSSAASFSQPLGPDSIKPALEGVWTRSVHDALLIISRCLEGELPMVHRRPYDIEKKELVKSGSVFIYS
jgi:hypothetical protein